MTVASTDAIRKTIAVDAAPEVAFRVFTEQMGTWWPLATHTLLGGRGEDVLVEPHVGGRVYERAGSEEARWGEVLAWEPPTRFAMTWEITNDRGSATEVDVTFAPDGAGTRVELTHSGWERLRSDVEETRASYDPGWDFVLARYAASVSRS